MNHNASIVNVETVLDPNFNYFKALYGLIKVDAFIVTLDISSHKNLNFSRSIFIY